MYLPANGPSLQPAPPAETNITTPFEHTPTRSSQGFQSVPQGQLADDVVGRPLPHLSATMQASGEATYVDDMPPLRDELYAGLVLSTRAHAKLVSVDASEAVAMPGVWGFVSARDVEEGESNLFRVGAAMDEAVFAEDEVGVVGEGKGLLRVHLPLSYHWQVVCRGQLIGLVLATDKLLAQRAARRVRVSYQELPSILTIQVGPPSPTRGVVWLSHVNAPPPLHTHTHTAGGNCSQLLLQA